MTQHFPTEEDFSRIEAILDQQVRIGECLEEKLKTIVADALRDKTVLIEERIEAAKGVAKGAHSIARQARESASELREAIGELQASIKVIAEDEQESRAQVSQLSTRIQELQAAARWRTTIVLWVALISLALSLGGLALWAW